MSRSDRHRTTPPTPAAGEVRFPDGVVVRGAALVDRGANDDWREYGLYLDARWAPRWPAEVVDWPDLGVPLAADDAARAILTAHAAARSGRRVEVGCLGGVGRTGTVLACMAVLSGVPADDAVRWVRDHYDHRAVEGFRQEAWVDWFADAVVGRPLPYATGGSYREVRRHRQVRHAPLPRDREPDPRRPGTPRASPGADSRGVV